MSVFSFWDLFSFLVLSVLHSHCKESVDLFLFTFQVPQCYPPTGVAFLHCWKADVICPLLHCFLASLILELLLRLYWRVFIFHIICLLHIFYFSYCSIGVPFCGIFCFTNSLFNSVHFKVYTTYGVIFLLRVWILCLDSRSVILMEEFSFYLLELFQNLPFSFPPYHDPSLPLCLWRLSM